MVGSVGDSEPPRTWTLSGGSDDPLRLSDLWGEAGAPAERSGTSRVVSRRWEETHEGP